jgi:hypothetical protein
MIPGTENAKCKVGRYMLHAVGRKTRRFFNTPLISASNIIYFARNAHKFSRWFGYGTQGMLNELCLLRKRS